MRKLVILNSHGGNDFKPVLRELIGQSPVHLFLCEWYRSLSADVQKQIFDDAGDHAGEMETAFGLAYFPHLVATDPQTGRMTADDGAVRATRLDAVNRGWVSITRPWHLLTTNTGVGNPHPATAEKGRHLVEVVVQRLSDFLVELSSATVDERFPY
jgi:creatinine amidohydrolase